MVCFCVVRLGVVNLGFVFGIGDIGLGICREGRVNLVLEGFWCFVWYFFIWFWIFV